MKNLFSLTILAAALMLAACSDDTNPTPKTPVQPGTEDGFSDLRNDALKDLIQEKTFNAGEPVEFTTDNGVTFKWSGNLYPMDSWTAVTGEVKLQYAEIFDRGNMAAANRPLMAKYGQDADGNKLYRPLITGGEFYVNMTTLDGKQLRTSWEGYQITVPGSLTGGINTGMILWEGDTDDDDNFFWEEFKDFDGNKERNGKVGYDGNDYNLFCNDFGWTNIDILAGEDGEKTPVFVRPPHGWNNKNSCVYVAYKNKPFSLAFMDQFLTDKGYFTEHYGLAPIGFEFYVIFAAEKDGKYVYWIKEVKVKEKEVIEVPQDELGTCTKEEFIKKINALK